MGARERLRREIERVAIDRLKAALGPEGWTDDPERIAPHLVEWRDRWTGSTPVLLEPATTAQAQTIMGVCRDAGLAITPQGGNTGLVGGQIPQGEVLVSTRRLTAIRSVDPTDDAIVAEAGVTLAQVRAAAAAVGRRFPLTLASEGSATVGGLISTNAGGMHVRRHGMTRALTAGLEVVLPDASLFSELSGVRKDNTGYDLKHLFIGAEGTLGLVTAACLRLSAIPRRVAVALAAVAEPDDAIALLHRLEAETGAVAVFELMNRTIVDLAAGAVAGVRDPFAPARPDWLVLIECEAADDGLGARVEAALAGAAEAGLIVDALVAQSDAQAQAFRRLRETMSAAQKGEGVAAKHDVCVPISAVPALLREGEAAARRVWPGARIAAFGHAGDGNIHFNVLQPKGADPAPYVASREAMMEAVHDVTVALGGSISAEHGIGVARRDEFLRREPPAHLALMRSIKRALDPDGLCNPRVLL